MRREAKEYGFEVLRAAIAYTVYTVLGFILSSIFVLFGGGIVKALDIPFESIYAVSVLGQIFASYSVFRAFELYDLNARRAFVAVGNDKYSLLSDIRITFSERMLLFKMVIQTLTVLLLAFILPYELGYGYLMRAIVRVLPMNGTKTYFMKSAIVCPLLLLIILLAKTSAHKWWIVARTAERERMDQLTHPRIRLFLEILKICAVYTVSFATLPTVIMLFVSLILTLGLFRVKLWMIPVMLALILVPFVLKRIFTLNKRRRYLRRLWRTLRAKGYEISEVNAPLISAVREVRGATFVMTRGEEKYAVKLITSLRRRKPVFINQNGFFTVKNTVSFMKITLFHLMTDIEYGFESEYEKIAVFSPLPKRIFLNWGRTDTAYDDGDGGSLPTVVAMRAAVTSGARGSSHGLYGPGYKSDIDRGIIKPFETGEKIGGVKFFTPRGFLSAVDNDCVKR